MTFEIIVQLKQEVLDPEGRAIQESLNRLGFQALRSVAVTRRYLLDLDESEAKAAALAQQIAREFLANPVSETFQVKKV